MKIDKPSAQNELTQFAHWTSSQPQTEGDNDTDDDTRRAFDDSEFLIHIVDATLNTVNAGEPSSTNANTIASHFLNYLGIDYLCIYSADISQHHLQPIIQFANGQWVDVIDSPGLPMPDDFETHVSNAGPADKNNEFLRNLASELISSNSTNDGVQLECHRIYCDDAAALSGLAVVGFADRSSGLDQRRRNLCGEFGRLVLSWFASIELEHQQFHSIAQQHNVFEYCHSLFHQWSAEHGWQPIAENTFNDTLPPPKDSQTPLPFCSVELDGSDFELAKTRFDHCLATGEGFEFDYAVRDTGGDIHYFNSKINRLHQHADNAVKLIATSRDITNTRAKEQQAIKQAETEKWLVSHTNSLFNNADLPAINRALREIANLVGASRCSVRIKDPNTQEWMFICQWHSDELPAQMDTAKPINKQILTRLVTVLERERTANIINDNLVEVTDPDLLAFHKDAGIRAYIIQPMHFEDELVGYLALLCDKPHQWTPLEQRASKVSAEAIHMVLMRMRLMESYHTSEERMQLAMAVTNYGMWEHDVTAQRMIFSPTYLHMLGYQPGDLSDHEDVIMQLIHPDDVEQAVKKIEHDYARADGVIFLESRHRAKSGEYHWIQTKGKVVERDKNGAPLRVIGANTDITDLKSTLYELKIARTKAEKANIAKSEFLARMSHEIRTPMNAIIGLAYLCLQSELTDEQKNYLQDIESAGNSLLHIIDDILDFSKIEAGQLSIELEEFDLIEELRRITKLMSVRADQSSVELSFEAAPDVPSRVIGDQTRVSQIITNLLSNAIKFTKKGRVSLTVENLDDGTTPDTQTLMFAVSDSGIGLSEQQIANLFQPFIQADGSTSRKYGGTGLGLSISKHLVEMMGGSINVISQPNIGTTFHFSIVFKKSDGVTHRDNDKTDRANSVGPDNHSGSFLKGKQVLLVEDNTVNQKVAIGLLKKVGVAATVANNGSEALELLKDSSSRFDAVLMDIEMPIMDGLSTARSIRNMDAIKHIPIIAMTAHAMKGDREKCLAAGMNEYIAKPIKPELLFRALWEYCR